MTLNRAVELLRLWQKVDSENYEGAAIVAGTDGADELLAEQLNWACEVVAEFVLLYDPWIPFHPQENVQAYSLSDLSVVGRPVVSLDYLVVNDIRLKGPDGEPGVWSATQLDRKRSKWRTATKGTPSRVVVLGDDSIIVNPAPDAEHAGYTWFAAGEYLPRPMTFAADSGAQLPVPYKAHHAAVHLAAYLSGSQAATHDEALDKLQRFQAMAYSEMEGARRRSADARLGATPTFEPEGYVFT